MKPPYPLLLALPLLGACAAGGPPPPVELSEGRGYYWNRSAERLAEDGYPDGQHRYRDPNASMLLDADGIPYGKGSYFQGAEALEHPYLELGEDYLESARGIRLWHSGCCTVPLLGNALELLDQALVELQEQLQLDLPTKLNVYTPADLEEYARLTGREYWVTHVVEGNNIVLEPVDVLYRRMLVGHATRAAVALALLDLNTHGQLPPWLREGLSSYLAEEGREHVMLVQQFRLAGVPVLLAPEQVVRDISPLVDLQAGRLARYNAFLMVWQLSERHGFARVRELLGRLSQGSTFEAACRQVYGLGHEALLERLDPREFGEPSLVPATPQ